MFIRLAGLAALSLAMAAAPAPQDPKPVPVQEDTDPFRVHIRMHKKVAPKVCLVRGRREMGTGVVIRSDGIILTSPTATGSGSQDSIQVVLPGNRRLDAKVIGRRHDLELVLLKVDAKDLPFMEFADSAKARVGQVAYAFGDCFQSIDFDDQVAMSLGIVSGMYEVTDTKGNSFYTGPVIETSAAVNQNLDGGPLVDAQGKMIGMVTLNYHPAKFTGIAIPAHVLKPEVDTILKNFDSGKVDEHEPGIVGITAEEAPGQASGVVIVQVVPGSPADKAKLKVGDQILRIDSERVTSINRFQRVTEDIRAGVRIRFQVRRGEQELSIWVTPQSRNAPPPKTEY
jgi:serine protease Do